MNRLMNSTCLATICLTSIAWAQPSIPISQDQQSPSGPVDSETSESSTGLLSYDASLGTLPTEQGWDLIGTFDGDDQVVDGVFQLNATSGIVGAQSMSVGFDWSVGLRYSMRVRVPVGTVAVTSVGPGYRGGANLSGKDSFGRRFSVLVGADSFVFTSHSNNNPDPTLTVQMPFDAASDFHTYSIVSDAGGATLQIDGVPRAHVPYGGVILSGSPAAQWYIDTRAFAVQSEWTNVDFTTDLPCSADLNGDGVLNFFDVSAFINAFSAGCP